MAFIDLTAGQGGIAPYLTQLNEFVKSMALKGMGFLPHTRVGAMIAFLSSWVLLTTAVLVALSALTAPLGAFVIPIEVQQVWIVFLPSNTGDCLVAAWTAKLTLFVFQQKLFVATHLSSLQKV